MVDSEPKLARRRGAKHSTDELKLQLARFANLHVSKLSQWLTKIANKDPAKALELYLRVIEFVAPKLRQAELTGKDGEPVAFSFQLDLSAAKPQSQLPAQPIVNVIDVTPEPVALPARTQSGHSDPDKPSE